VTDAELCWNVLVCPDCRGALAREGAAVRCGSCGSLYGAHGAGGLDLRLQRPKKVKIEYAIGTEFPDCERPDLSPLAPNPHPEVDFSGCSLPIHLPPEMASHLPKASRPDALCLDFGCGNGEYRAAIEHAGFRWLGVDYNHPQAPFLADGHALPFAAGTFDLVVSLAVLEHVRFPYLVAEEIHRVLRPGGTYYGSVTYLTPFHQDSFFNMTHHGTLSVLRHAGFQVQRIAADQRYLGIRAIAYEGLFRPMRRSVAYALTWPLVLLHRIWWAIGRLRRPGFFDRTTQMLLNTGAFVFVAHKPAATRAEREH
jgi:SAM-dependent methyltransferase